MLHTSIRDSKKGKYCNTTKKYKEEEERQERKARREYKGERNTAQTEKRRGG